MILLSAVPWWHLPFICYLGIKPVGLYFMCYWLETDMGRHETATGEWVQTQKKFLRRSLIPLVFSCATSLASWLQTLFLIIHMSLILKRYWIKRNRSLGNWMVDGWPNKTLGQNQYCKSYKNDCVHVQLSNWCSPK